MDNAQAAEAFAAEAQAVTTVDNTASGVDAPTVTPTSPQVPTQTSKFYTEDDLVKVRSQEKDKLYPVIEKLKEEVEALRKDKDSIAAQKAAEEAAELARKKQESEADMEVRDLLKVKETEWQQQLERERLERERAFALLEQERAFAELQSYRQQRLESEREAIIPELVDLIVGNTKEEIEDSIAGLKERSSRILESAQQAMQAARRDMTGTRVTSPQTGPMDINTGNRQFSAEEISAMPLNEYAKYRQQLLSPTAQGRTQGLFG